MRYWVTIFLLMAAPCFGATYYVDDTDGDDADSGATEALAWKTPEKAMNTVAAGDIVYLQNTSDFDIDDTDAGFSAVAVIDTAGTQLNPIVFEGYTSTIGDNGQAVFNAATNTLTNCVMSNLDGNNYYVFRNIRFTGAADAAINESAEDKFHFVNCRFDNNGQEGVFLDNYASFMFCVFDNNANKGLFSDQDTEIYFCKFFSNGTTGATLQNGFVHGSLFYNNVGHQLQFDSNAGPQTVMNCTFDGEGAAATNVGVEFSVEGVSSDATQALFNSIIYDMDTGVIGDSLTGPAWMFAANNLFNSNTTDRTNYPVGYNDISSAPAFTNEAGDDYTLGGASPALNAGYSLNTLDAGTEGMDIGAYQEQDAGGAGGILIHPGMDGGMQ